MIKEAIEYIVGLSDNHPREIFRGCEEVTMQHAGPDGGFQVDTYDLDAERVRHGFETIDGFESYLKKHAANDATVVFVGKNVEAIIGYASTVPDSAILSLNHSPEYIAIQELKKWKSQRDVWRPLISTLRDAFDPELLLQVKACKIDKKTATDIQIQDSGIAQGGGGASVDVLFTQKSGKGDAQETVQLDWRAKLPIWRCWPIEFDFDLRIELAVDEHGELKMMFHVIREHAVLDKARLDLVAELRDRLADYQIFEGERHWNP